MDSAASDAKPKTTNRVNRGIVEFIWKRATLKRLFSARHSQPVYSDEELALCVLNYPPNGEPSAGDRGRVTKIAGSLKSWNDEAPRPHDPFKGHIGQMFLRELTQRLKEMGFDDPKIEWVFVRGSAKEFYAKIPEDLRSSASVHYPKMRQPQQLLYHYPKIRRRQRNKKAIIRSGSNLK